MPDFSPQPSAGSRTWARRAVSVVANMSETTTSGTCGQRRGHGVGFGHRDDRVGAEDPQDLDPALGAGAEQVDGLEPGLVRQCRRVPELLHEEAVRGVLEVEMGGEHVREAADLAAAHGVGLAGDAERAHAGPADAAGGEVAVDDRVDLVGAGGRLVHALAEDGDDALGADPEVEEGGEVGRGEAGGGGVGGLGRGEGGVEAGDVGAR